MDIGYTPWSWLTLPANYTREEYHLKQRESGSLTNVTRDWISKGIDTYHTVGAGTIFRLVPDRLDLTADYAFQLSIAKLNTFSPAEMPFPGFANLGVDFPDDRFSLHRISGVLRYWLLKNFAVRAGYTYERFRESYWQADFIQPMNAPGQGTAATDVFLGVHPYKNYEVHIIGGGISYGF